MTTPVRSHARDRAFSASALLPTVGFMVLGIVTILVLALIGLSRSGLQPGASGPPPKGLGPPKLQITPTPVPVPPRVTLPGGTEVALPATVDLQAIGGSSALFHTSGTQGLDDTVDGGPGSGPVVVPAVITEPGPQAPAGPSPVNRPPQTHRPPPAGPPTSPGPGEPTEPRGQPGHGCTKQRVGSSTPEQCRQWCKQAVRDDDRATPDQCRKWCQGTLWPQRPDGDYRVRCTQQYDDSETAAREASNAVPSATVSLSRTLGTSRDARPQARAKPKPEAEHKRKAEHKPEAQRHAKPKADPKSKRHQQQQPRPCPKPRSEDGRPPTRSVRLAEATVTTRSQPQQTTPGTSASSQTPASADQTPASSPTVLP